VFGDRWGLLVLRDIVFGDRRYFGGFFIDEAAVPASVPGRCGRMS
jgi:hypothetical protein